MLNWSNSHTMEISCEERAAEIGNNVIVAVHDLHSGFLVEWSIYPNGENGIMPWKDRKSGYGTMLRDKLMTSGCSNQLNRLKNQPAFHRWNLGWTWRILSFCNSCKRMTFHGLLQRSPSFLGSGEFRFRNDSFGSNTWWTATPRVLDTGNGSSCFSKPVNTTHWKIGVGDPGANVVGCGCSLGTKASQLIDFWTNETMKPTWGNHILLREHVLLSPTLLALISPVPALSDNTSKPNPPDPGSARSATSNEKLYLKSSGMPVHWSL